MAVINFIRVAVKSNDICMRNPVDQKRLTTDGIRVVKNAFWTRRIKQKDVVELPLIAEEKTLLTPEENNEHSI